MHIDHIGIAVNDLAVSVKKYESLLGVKAVFEKMHGMEVAILKTDGGKFELLADDNPNSPIGKFLIKNGEGLHHVAVDVDDVAAYLKRATDLNIRLIDKEMRPGVENKMIAFLHPSDLHGVLLEFCMDKLPFGE